MKARLLRSDLSGAEEVLHGFVPPGAIHPDAYLAWIDAQASLELARGDVAAAREIFEQLDLAFPGTRRLASLREVADRIDAQRFRTLPARAGRKRPERGGDLRYPPCAAPSSSRSGT